MTGDAAFSRLAKLFDVGLLKDARVLIAGCGSGGSQVTLQLVDVRHKPVCAVRQRRVGD